MRGKIREMTERQSEDGAKVFVLIELTDTAGLHDAINMHRGHVVLDEDSNVWGSWNEC